MNWPLPPSVPLSARLPKWNSVQQNPNGSLNWSWLHDIKPGEHMEVELFRYTQKTAPSTLGRRWGKVMTIRTLPNGRIRAICLDLCEPKRKL